ncbi:MAG: molybdopterin molybdotransferase MoeA [Alphaproteobacteria bacterium]
MISVSEALTRILAGVSPVSAETVALSAAHHRTLAEDLVARTTQPPVDVSAMDGWAVRIQDVTSIPVTLKVVGSIAAGQDFSGKLRPGEAMRIFTGAPIPEGADSVVIQENTSFDDALTKVVIEKPVNRGAHIRVKGLDFHAGAYLLKKGTILSARHIALAAAMNQPWIKVMRRPRIAILATGDEVVMPGDPLGPTQIVSSNSHGLAALVTEAGGEPIMLGIAPDRSEPLQAMALAAKKADVLVTTGGASVGDHDLVRSALESAGLRLDFWKIAMRPGKPLMFGELTGTPFLGLPGNPVSTFVCAVLFLQPMVRRMLGHKTIEPQRMMAILGDDLAANDQREDYLRAALTLDEGTWIVRPFPVQDSAMMTPVVMADCLLVRPPHAPMAKAGSPVAVIPLRPLF